MKRPTPADGRAELPDRGLNLRLRALIIAAPVVVFLLVLTIVAVGLTLELGRQAKDREKGDLGTLGRQIGRRIGDVAQLARAIRDAQVRHGADPMPGMQDYLRFLLEAQPRAAQASPGDQAKRNAGDPAGQGPGDQDAEPLVSEVQGVYIGYEAVPWEERGANPWYDWKWRGEKWGTYDFKDCSQARNSWYCDVKELRDDQFGLTGPYYDEDTRMSLVNVTLPVRAGGRFVGVAGVDFRLKGLGEIVSGLALSPDDGYAYLVASPSGGGEPVVFAETKDLDLIARPMGSTSPKDARRAFRPISEFPFGDRIAGTSSDYLREFVDRDGNVQLISWEELTIEGAPTTRWKIVRAVPSESVWRTYNYVKKWCLLGGLPGLVAILLLAAWLAERALGPIPRLAAAAAAVEQGRYDAESLAGVAHRRDEMGQLARGFRKMVGVLADREAELRRSEAELAGRERHFRALIEHSSDLVSIIGPDGNLRYRSPSARGILDVAPEEAVGSPALDAIHPDDRAAFAAMAEAPADDRAPLGSVEYRIRHRDGSYRVMEGNYADLRRDPDVGGIVLNSRDVTDRKADETKIRRLADDLRRERDGLEDRVRDRTAELERKNDELGQKNDELLAAKEATEQAMKQKDVFLDNIAHDLRTPLAVVLGYSKDLHEQAVEDGLDDYAEDLGKVINRGQDLLEFVNDLLQLSKSRGNSGVHLDLAEFGVGAMLDDRLAGLDWLAKNTGNTITTRIEEGVGSIVADQVKVWRVLMNLLTNACKFTPAGGRVEVSAARLAEGGRDWIVFRVADTGKGMNPEQRLRLFRRFSQVQGTADELRDGFGLGLSICQLYCHAMGGRIEVESAEGIGTTFAVTLPTVVDPGGAIGGPPGGAASTPRARPEGPPPPRERDGEQGSLVLIIDDDPLICELMQRSLEGGGIATRAAHDGIEGLRLARELQPSVILLDVLMPVIDGWAVLATLKTDPATAKIPVIMASILDERQRGLTMGADDYVSKPVTRESLAQLLQKHVDGREAGRLLVVEDDPDARSRLCRSLRQQGWEVIEAADGAEALALIGERQPDLILLDLRLPRVDGFGVVEEMMKDSRMRLIPIVVMSGKDLGPEDHSRLDGHVGQVFQKGAYDRKELLRTIRSLVREYQRRSPPSAPERGDGQDPLR